MPMCGPSLKAYMEISLLRLIFDSRSFLSVPTVKSGRHHHMNLKVRFNSRSLTAFDHIPFKSHLLPILTFRWPLRLTQARKEAKEFEGVSFSFLGSFENSTSFEASCHGRISSRHMPLESQWTSIPSTNGHSTTILLPKGKSRL
jgi:hypothetical protein